MSGETCSVCNWTNTECLNLGDVGKPKWMCHGCIKRAVDSLQSHKSALEKAREALDKIGFFCAGEGKFDYVTKHIEKTLDVTNSGKSPLTRLQEAEVLLRRVPEGVCELPDDWYSCRDVFLNDKKNRKCEL